MIPRSLGALVLGCLLALGLSGSALAHAELVESDPVDGGIIETPAELTATFSEELVVDGSNVIVRNQAGQEVARGAVDDEPEAMVVELPALPAGDYVARWTARGDDGHVTRGEIRFSVEAAVAAPTPVPASATPAPATEAPGTPQPALSPSPTPSPSPSPEPGNGAPTAGMTDVLLALVLAGAVIGGLAVYLLRRR